MGGAGRVEWGIFMYLLDFESFSRKKSLFERKQGCRNQLATLLGGGGGGWGDLGGRRRMRGPRQLGGGGPPILGIS